MILPTIHSNGSDAATLRQQYLNAGMAVSNAVCEVKAVDFNARDYYPQGDDAYRQASRERDAMLAKLDEVLVYLSAHVTHIEAIQDARAERQRQHAAMIKPPTP